MRSLYHSIDRKHEKIHVLEEWHFFMSPSFFNWRDLKILAEPFFKTVQFVDERLWSKERVPFKKVGTTTSLMFIPEGLHCSGQGSKGFHKVLLRLNESNVGGGSMNF
jgi:hypothetical protein